MKTLYTILTITILLCLSLPETAQAQYHEQGMPCNMLKAEDSLKLAGRPPMQINIGDCTDLDDPNPGGGGEEDKTEDPPFEYDIDFNNIGELLYLAALLEAAANEAEQRWLDEQEETFRNEINEMFDTHHSTFKAAQEAFFREFESETLGFERTASDEAYQHRQIADRMDTDQEVVTTELYHMEEWKDLWEFCKDWEGADCDKFGSKTVQGTRLRDIATQHQFDQLLGQAETDFAELEFDAAQERAWADGIWNMVHDGSYYESIIRARMSQYDNLSRRDRVFLMTNYILTYNYPGNAPMATPTFISDLPSYWHSETLFGLGKEMAPTPSIEALVFYPDYIEDSYNDCQSGRPKNDRGVYLGPDNCTPRRTELEELKESITWEHIDLHVADDAPPSCESFNFVQVSDNWQEANVQGIYFEIWLTFTTPPYLKYEYTVKINQEVNFGAPLVDGRGTELPPGTLASASAYALHASMKDVIKKYGRTKTATSVVESYFKKRIKHNYPLHIIGGRAITNAQFGPDPTQYRATTRGDFDGCHNQD